MSTNKELTDNLMKPQVFVYGTKYVLSINITISICRTDFYEILIKTGYFSYFVETYSVKVFDLKPEVPISNLTRAKSASRALQDL